jgi:hypothetical protein
MTGRLLALVCVMLLSLTPALPTSGADYEQTTGERERSAILQQLAPRYAQIARENIVTAHGRTAIVPSPAYANGIYARDAFFAAVGLDDLELSFKLYTWFADGQNKQTGQVPTAIAFDPADQSLQPQDDESTLLFIIWSFILHRAHYDIDRASVAAAWDHVQTHVRNGLYYSAAGNFRYWADCWTLPRPGVIAYVQGLYALAAEAAHDFGFVDDDKTVAAAKNGYRALYNDPLGFLPLGAGSPGRSIQDVSALLPEFLHRLLLAEGILADAQVLATVDHHLATLGAHSGEGTLIGLRVLADSTGAFLSPALFAAGCANMSRPGDYHNGGYWPMYTLVELALAYAIAPETRYRLALEQLVAYEAEQGMGVEYMQLVRGAEGYVPPRRGHYSWNVLALLALRYAELVK